MLLLFLDISSNLTHRFILLLGLVVSDKTPRYGTLLTLRKDVGIIIAHRSARREWGSNKDVTGRWLSAPLPANILAGINSNQRQSSTVMATSNTRRTLACMVLMVFFFSSGKRAISYQSNENSKWWRWWRNKNRKDHDLCSWRGEIKRSYKLVTCPVECL